MDVTVLKLKADLVAAHEKKRHALEILSVEESEVVLAPLFTLFEGSEGELNLDPPSTLEMKHITEDLTLLFKVERSDITGLFLKVETQTPKDGKRWDLLLRDLQERIGKMARLHPRLTIPEFEIKVVFGHRHIEPGKIFDLSEGGMSVVTNATAQVGAKVVFKILIPESVTKRIDQLELAWMGSVRNILPRGLGIQFDPSPSFHKTIRLILDQITRLRAQRLVHPRYNISDFDVGCTVRSVEKEKGEPVNVQVKDINFTGCYLVSETSFSFDHRVELIFLPHDEFQQLDSPIRISARAIHGRTDGFGVRFTDLSEKNEEWLKAWIKEIADKLLRPTTGEQLVETIKPKATLSINYGTDLLAVRDYLYNLGSGGFVLPAISSMQKGDVIRFIIDFQDPLLAEKFADIPPLLGKVMRVTEHSLGVQFLDPDMVRRELEEIMGDLIRKTNSALEPIPWLEESNAAEEASQKTAAPSYSILSHRFIGLGVAVISVLAVTVFIFFSHDSSFRRSLFVQPSSVRTMNKAKKVPGKIYITVAGKSYSIDVTQVVDVNLDPKGAPQIILKDGTVYPAGPLIIRLPKRLREKLKRLSLEYRKEREINSNVTNQSWTE